MKRLFLALAVLQTIALPGIAHATEPDAVVAPSVDMHTARALELAAILNSEAMIVGGEKSDQQAKALMLELFATQTYFQTLESVQPGITGEIADAMMPIINNSLRVRLPELHRRQAELYKRQFSTSELVTLAKFYTSPTGQKLLEGVAENMRTDAMAAEAKKSDDFTITSKSVIADLRAAVPEALKTMTPGDEQVLIAFANSGLLPRIQKISSKSQTLTLDWTNESLPGEEEELDAATNAVLAKYDLDAL